MWIARRKDLTFFKRTFLIYIPKELGRRRLHAQNIVEVLHDRTLDLLTTRVWNSYIELLVIIRFLTVFYTENCERSMF